MSKLDLTIVYRQRGVLYTIYHHISSEDELKIFLEGIIQKYSDDIKILNVINGKEDK